jgi:hypothetical protein
MIWLLATLFSSALAAQFGIYYDSECSIPITSSLAFTDVCTWSSNRYSGSWSVSLSSCNSTNLVANVYNASLYPTCQGDSSTLSISAACTKVQDSYIRANDFSCTSENTTYNILAHFQSDCKDGGIPFSIQLGNPSCQADSFAPGFLNLDTRGSYENGLYQMSLYNTSNGECQNQSAIFQTPSFPATCIAPQDSSEILFVDIYNAFPISP